MRIVYCVFILLNICEKFCIDLDWDKISIIFGEINLCVFKY